MEIKNQLDAISAMLDVYIQVTQMNGCRNCGKQDCEYRPKNGELMRLNCPLWEGGSNG